MSQAPRHTPFIAPGHVGRAFISEAFEKYRCISLQMSRLLHIETLAVFPLVMGC